MITIQVQMKSVRAIELNKALEMEVKVVDYREQDL